MRILERLEQLATIGDRIGYSAEEDAAHGLATGWFRQAGLEVEVDAAGNLIGRIPAAPRRLDGVTLDTVPGAGRFDGTLGVVAGLEAVEALGSPGLGVVVFRDEERGCAGSRGCTALPDAYVELHIEQGPTLLAADAPVGVVSAIVGYVRGHRTFTGTAGHAGTTPMDVREDALVQAAEFVLHARDAARGIEGAVATVGQVAVEPGGTNVIPGRVVLSVDAAL
jgi:acetylornithine deacetylase/succinyl-diaminopimelate desuccinylase-like protein